MTAYIIVCVPKSYLMIDNLLEVHRLILISNQRIVSQNTGSIYDKYGLIQSIDYL